MTLVRTTIVLDEVVVAKVKQSFSGNLSKGINAILKEHLFKEKSESAFGLLKGKVSLGDWKKLHDEEKKEEERHGKVYR